MRLLALALLAGLLSAQTPQPSPFNGGAGASGSSIAGDVTGTLGASSVVKIRGLAVKSGMSCPSDGYVVTWVAANSQFECLAAASVANTHVTFSNAASVSMTLTGVSNKAVVQCVDTVASPPQWFIPDHITYPDANTATAYFVPNATGYCNASTGVGATGAAGPTGPAGPISSVPGSGSELQYRVNSTTLGALSGSSVSGTDLTLPGNLTIGTTNPANITGAELALAGSLFFSGFPTIEGLNIWGKYAVLGMQDGKTQFVDLSKIGTPTTISTVTTSGDNWSSWAFGKYLYWATGGANAFLTYDVSNIHAPSSVSSISTPGCYAFKLVGNTLYCAGTHLNVYDFTNRANPTLLSSFVLAKATNSRQGTLVVRGDYAYVGLGGGPGGIIQIVNVSSPAAPVSASVIDPGGNAAGVLDLSGRYLFVGQPSDDDEAACPSSPQTSCTLLVYDVSDPTSPVFVVGAKTNGGDANDHAVNAILVRNTRLYVGTEHITGSTCPGQCEIQAFDISNPANPVSVGGYNHDTGDNNNIFSLGFFGRYLLFGDDEGNFVTLDTPGYVGPGISVGSVQTETQQVTGDIDVGGIIHAGTALKAGPGGINSQGTISGPRLELPNCSSSAAPAVCSTYSTGSVVIAAAATTVTVNTAAVTANSEIVVIQDDGLGTKLGVTCYTAANTAPRITARTAGTSFTITATAPAVNPACYSYSIVN